MSARLLVFLLIMLTIAIVALSTGAAIYYMMLLVMLMMILLGIASVVVALMTVRANMETSTREYIRGATADLSVRVRYWSFLPIRSVQLVLLVPEDERAHETMDILLPPFLEKKFHFELPCPHVGVYHVGIQSVRVTDIFQLFTLKRRMDGSLISLEVQPRVVKLPAMELRSGDSEPTIITRATEDTASPSDVRIYQLGDPMKKIHWKLSLRKRELLVKTYEESSRPDTLILPDLSAMNFMRSQALTIKDAICEAAASIAKAQLSANYPVRMPLMSAAPSEASGQDEHSFSQFLDALMRVQFDSPYPYEQVLSLEMRRMQRTGGAVLITARLTPRIADIAQQLKRYGMQVCVCWVTETRRAEAMEMLERLRLMGIQAIRVDPWEKGLNADAILSQQSQVSYG